MSVEVASRATQIREGYKHYLRHFLIDGAVVPHESIPDYAVRDFSDFAAPRAYRKDGPYMSFSSGFCIPKERYAVVMNDGHIEEYTTYANRATNLWVQTLLVPQGVSLVHGAGFSLAGRGLLCAGFGGVGKTLLISALKERSDFLFFGDDYVMVDGQGAMYAYPADFSIYPYHLSAFSELKDTQFSRYLTRRKLLPFYYEFQRAVNFFSRRFITHGTPILKGWNAPYVKVPAEVLVPKEKIGVKERLDACVFLTRGSGRSEVRLEEMSADEFTDALMGNLLLEFEHALPYLSALNAFGLFRVADFLVQQRSTLKQCVGDIRRYRISIPLDLSSSATTSAIVKHLEQII